MYGSLVQRHARWGLGLASLLFCGVASAQEAPTSAPPASPPAAAATPPPPVTEWWARYQAARELMARGNWEAAAAELDALVKTAPDPAASVRAADDAALCRTWIAGGLVLVPKSDLGESTVHARQADQRTIDELSVLYTNAVFYGLGTGVWLAVQTEPSSPAGGILPALGLAGASALGVYALDSGKPLRYGVPQSMVTGMYIGLYEGIAWTVWNQSRYRSSESWKGSTVATVIWGGATVGLAVGGLVGTQRSTTPGRASFIGSASLWTALIAGAVTAGVAPDDSDLDNRAWLAAALGVNAGALAGALTAGTVSPTIARVRFLDLGGIGGLLVSGGLFFASESKNERLAPLVMGLGTAAGLGVAWFATQGMTKDEPTTTTTAFQPHLVAAPAHGGATLGLAGAF